MSGQLTALLSSNGIHFRRSADHKNVRQGYIGIDCPWCGRASYHFHLGINENSLGGNCWRCGKVSVWKALMAYGIKAPDVKQLFDGRIVPRTLIKPQGELVIPRDAGSLMKPHIEYLRSRRIGKKTAKLWSLGGIGRLGGKLAWRLYVPVFWRGAQVSWTTRAITEEGLRWRAADPEQERLDSSRFLYGWDFVKSAAILVEGPADCWKIGPGAVCPLGLKLSDFQLDLLGSLPRRAVCFDAEPEAQRKASKLAAQLASLPGETIRCELERGNDPGDAPRSEIAELRREILGVE